MILFFYRPNFYQKIRPKYFSYQENQLDDIEPSLSGYDEEMVGWYFEYKERIFSPIKNLVMFENQQQLFIDFGQGALNLSSRELTFSKEKTSSYFYVDFFKNKQKIYSIYIKIYWWQHWMHDGSFPEDICPLNVALDRIDKDLEVNSVLS